MSRNDDISFDNDRLKAIALTISEYNAECRKYINRLHNNMITNVTQDSSNIHTSDITDVLTELRDVRFLNNLMKSTSDILDLYIRSMQYDYDTYKQSYVWPRMIYIIRIGKNESYLPEKRFFRKVLRHVVLESDSLLEYVGSKCFAMCPYLISINLPHCVRDIGEYAFKNCRSLRYVQIPKNVKYLERGLFSGCTSLSKFIDIPSGVLSIEKHAFKNCHSIKTVTINSPIININDNAFHNCEQLSDIVISDDTRCIVISLNESSIFATTNHSENVDESFSKLNCTKLAKYLWTKFQNQEDNKMSLYRFTENESLDQCGFTAMLGIKTYQLLRSEIHKDLFAFVNWEKISKIRNPNTNRYPLFDAADYGLRVDHGLKSIYQNNAIAILEKDPVTSLDVFILACISQFSRLEIIYYLIKQNPQAVINFIISIPTPDTVKNERKRKITSLGTQGS